MASPQRLSVVRRTKRAMSSLIASPSSIRWGRTRCFTTTRSKPGASIREGGSAMSWHRNVIAGAIIVGALASSAHAYDFGRPATPDEIQLWDIDVRPDGKGLPDGSGTAAHGKAVYAENCEACHGPNGQGGIKDRLVGGQGTLASDNPIKTVGSYWPYATTLFDYIRRAMPLNRSKSLSNDEVYSAVAYLLNLNGIVPDDAAMNAQTLPKVMMPNRDGFVTFARG